MGLSNENRASMKVLWFILGASGDVLNGFSEKDLAVIEEEVVSPMFSEAVIPSLFSHKAVPTECKRFLFAQKVSCYWII
ncbi:unnamed protein product [Cylicostephanus goldi]|uniref:Uncharacterized protein n=1 Tax=Cylicostephanus goldi TaxID=71465 RepID=A0A3P7MPV8_CYLGO|nr:unnamed protein product [Cylicostephanus goldi]